MFTYTHTHTLTLTHMHNELCTLSEGPGRACAQLLTVMDDVCCQGGGWEAQMWTSSFTLCIFKSLWWKCIVQWKSWSCLLKGLDRLGRRQTGMRWGWRGGWSWTGQNLKGLGWGLGRGLRGLHGSYRVGNDMRFWSHWLEGSEDGRGVQNEGRDQHGGCRRHPDPLQPRSRGTFWRHRSRKCPSRLLSPIFYPPAVVC